MMLANEKTTITESPLKPYLSVERIHIGKEFASKKRLLEFLAEQLSETNNAKQQKRTFQALIERERLGSTGMGNGIAIPHGRCKHAENASLCIVTLTEGVDYDSADDISVNLVFGLITPEDANEEHLKLLSYIAQPLSQDNIKAELLKLRNQDDLLNFINKKLV